MIRTFVDAGVLIAAHRGVPSEREPALRLLRDPDRFFLASPFLYLETLPKALYYRNEAEVQFYRKYFERAIRYSFEDTAAISQLAREEAERCGLGAIDALHIAAASLAKAQEFITGEKPGKSIYRASLVRVVYLTPLAGPNGGR